MNTELKKRWLRWTGIVAEPVLLGLSFVFAIPPVQSMQGQPPALGPSLAIATAFFVLSRVVGRWNVQGVVSIAVQTMMFAIFLFLLFERAKF